jgi:hypothetical protein
VDVPRPEAHPAVPNPEPVQIAPIEWKVITRDRLPEGEFVLYGLTPRQYETLARNMADILRWVKEAQWRLEYYRGDGQLDGKKDVAP